MSDSPNKKLLRPMPRNLKQRASLVAVSLSLQACAATQPADPDTCETLGGACDESTASSVEEETQGQDGSETTETSGGEDGATSADGGQADDESDGDSDVSSSTDTEGESEGDEEESTESDSATDGTDETSGGDSDNDACPVPEDPASTLSMIAIEGDVEPWLQTDSTKADTAEVYCVPSLAPQQELPPVVMVPGLGLSHYMYLATPDRRASFASAFSDAGFHVYALNPKANAASALDTEEGDGLSRWGVDRFWRRWGFGPEVDTPHDDVRFPTDAIDDFVDHMPLWRSGNGRAELEELLELVGPAILMVHSAAGGDAFTLLETRPELAQYLVVLEPTGCPDEAAATPKLPFLAIYGDYIGPRGQSGRLESCRKTAEHVAAEGLPAEVRSYPDLEVYGNTHLMTQDDNNLAIAADIIERLKAELD